MYDIPMHRASPRPALVLLALVACNARDPAPTQVASHEPAPVSRPTPPPDPPAAVTPPPTPPPPKVPTLEELLADSTATPAELARVKAALKKDDFKDYTRGPDEQRLEIIKDLGDRRMLLLARFLTDYDLGNSAAEAMNILDSDRAAPLLFASMPRSDRNVQFRGLGRWSDRLRNGETPCCLVEMHAAAVRCLEADTNADAAERALVAIGLTGDTGDYPLLIRYDDNEHPTPYWQSRMRRAAAAALARLGSAPHLRRIEDELTAPVPPTITSEQSMRLAAVIDQAAFANDRRFLPLLCRHLGDPSPKDFTDAIPSMPAPKAAEAIDMIANKAPLRRASADIARARAWCEANK